MSDIAAVRAVEVVLVVAVHGFFGTRFMQNGLSFFAAAASGGEIFVDGFLNQLSGKRDRGYDRADTCNGKTDKDQNGNESHHKDRHNDIPGLAPVTNEYQNGVIE